MPTTQIRKVGTVDSYASVAYGDKASFRLSNGNMLYLCMDRNQSATVGNGDQSNTDKIYVYERDDVTDVVTLRQTITPGGDVSHVQGALFSNNDLGIGWRNATNDKIMYRKLTYAGYTLAAVETAVDLSGLGGVSVSGKIGRFDMDVTDDGAVLIGYIRNHVVASAYGVNQLGRFLGLLVRHTGNAWVDTPILWMSGQNDSVREYLNEAAGVCALGGTAGARNIVVAGQTKNTNETAFPFVIYTAKINTANGVISSLTQRLLQDAVITRPGFTYTGGYYANIKIFRDDTNTDKYVLGTAHNGGYAFAVGTYDGTTFNALVPWFSSYFQGDSIALGNEYISADGFYGMSYGGGSLNILVLTSGGKYDSTWRLGNLILHIVPALFTTLLKPWYTTSAIGKMDWPNAGVAGVTSGGNRNHSVDSHDVLVQYGGEGGDIKAVWSKVPPYAGGSGIVNLSPSTGSSVPSAQPDLTGQIDTGVAVDYTKYKLQFQFAENNTFTVGLIDYVQNSITHLTEVSHTDQVGVNVAFADILPVSAGSLHAGVWYHRARLVNEFGQTGAWTAVNNVTIGHPPVLVPLAPGASRYFSYGTGAIDLSWIFTDPSSTDYQTAYEVIVRNELTGATILDTGKVVSAAKFATVAIPIGNKDALLSWQVRGWDSDDANGNYSEKALFYLTDPPVVTITAPANGSTVVTPRPDVTFNVVTSGGRTVSDATVTVYQSGIPVWSKKIQIGAASGVSRTVRIDPGTLIDGGVYTVQVRSTDSSSLIGTSVIFTFTANWVPPANPAGLAVSGAHYNVEAEGYVQVTWNNSTDDANFQYYIVYRRDDLINVNTGAVIETGVPKVVFLDYTSSPTNEYRDFSAPSNYKVNYLVNQVATLAGVEIESQATAYVSATIASDGYWLIETDLAGNAIDAFKLHIVTGDSYADEQQEEELVVIGRGRVFNKGERLGVKGSLDARLRDTGIYTARQKKQRLEAIAEEGAPLWMRNPFGDVKKVNVSQINITRISGVGGSEFCDVTVPYAEVGG